VISSWPRISTDTSSSTWYIKCDNPAVKCDLRYYSVLLCLSRPLAAFVYSRKPLASLLRFILPEMWQLGAEYARLVNRSVACLMLFATIRCDPGTSSSSGEIRRYQAVVWLVPFRPVRHALSRRRIISRRRRLGNRPRRQCETVGISFEYPWCDDFSTSVPHVQKDSVSL